MERIVLELDDKVAKAWHAYPLQKKQKLQKEIEARLADNIRKEEKEEFLQYLEVIQKSAEENGLTQEILEQLLNEEN
jgi:predicted house-cleaning noncanonical NTP pyrophosphatase (MazG superfamily)